MAPREMDFGHDLMPQKPYDGSPFGSQSHRFDVSGVHPNMKKQGSYTEVAYERKSLTPRARQLGPGRYSLDTRRSVTPGPGWERAVEVARMAKMPHLLYRETWEREKQAKLNMGPGRYNSRDFIQELSDRVHS
ncbi:ciliary microtubule-associated protein 2-like, partial [Symsagittifera roscoffensis]|uniref:ciliary microtubule-associated protein 2-like n=1 Tax=Symsagittifera roscoffensis TaxID=84072 RepID=UPI00307C8BF8